GHDGGSFGSGGASSATHRPANEQRATHRPLMDRLHHRQTAVTSGGQGRSSGSRRAPGVIRIG
ncbi:hypothetical protein ACFU6K_29920, partial [Kitasatospora sp. NPDC057512]|uniref:hypothetical protein n=1 Tax=Kitasatospora sp. NPDC057512 TaxID=3346154 RepID=UPI0036AA5049